MQKKDINAKKKGRKYIFNFEIHTKNIKKGKKKAHLFGFFSLLPYIPPLCIFLHFKLKNSYKKTKMQNKSKKKNCFKLQKYICKKAENNISKKDTKKADMQ